MIKMKRQNSATKNEIKVQEEVQKPVINKEIEQKFDLSKFSRFINMDKINATRLNNFSSPDKKKSP